LKETAEKESHRKKGDTDKKTAVAKRSLKSMKRLKNGYTEQSLIIRTQGIGFSYPTNAV